MKVILYSTLFTSPFSILCTLITAYPVSHAAIIHDGKHYETTFLGGQFEETEIKDSNRMVTVYDFPDIDPTEYLKKNLGTKYDRLGMLSYPLSIFNKSLGNNPLKSYCFETVSELLIEEGLGMGLVKGNHLSARDLNRTLARRLDMVGLRMTSKKAKAMFT